MKLALGRTDVRSFRASIMASRTYRFSRSGRAIKYILVTGSREFDKPEMVWEAIVAEISGLGWDQDEGGDYEIVLGDCPTGADKHVRDVLGDQCKVFEAKWEEYGKVAGPIRNQEMVDYVAAEEGEKVCLSFWQTGAGNRGTRNCTALALASGIPVKRFWN